MTVENVMKYLALSFEKQLWKEFNFLVKLCTAKLITFERVFTLYCIMKLDLRFHSQFLTAVLMYSDFPAWFEDGLQSVLPVKNPQESWLWGRRSSSWADVWRPHTNGGQTQLMAHFCRSVSQCLVPAWIIFSSFSSCSSAVAVSLNLHRTF